MNVANLVSIGKSKFKCEYGIEIIQLYIGQTINSAENQLHCGNK